MYSIYCEKWDKIHHAADENMYIYSVYVLFKDNDIFELFIYDYNSQPRCIYYYICAQLRKVL